MWRLKIAEGDSPYLYSTNNFVGRQIWEFNHNAGTPEEREAQREAFQKARDEWSEGRKKGFHSSGDLFLRLQLKGESGIDLLGIPPVRIEDEEEISYEKATIAVKKALRLNRAVQASDGHWPAENAGPMFFTPPLLIALYISGTINTVLTSEHIKEMIRFIYNHQNADGGWGFYVAGHSTMIGSALSYVTLRILGEGPDAGNGAMARGRKWILDHEGAIGIPSWGKTYLSDFGIYMSKHHERSLAGTLANCRWQRLPRPKACTTRRCLSFNPFIAPYNTLGQILHWSINSPGASAAATDAGAACYVRALNGASSKALLSTSAAGSFLIRFTPVHNDQFEVRFQMIGKSEWGISRKTN